MLLAVSSILHLFVIADCIGATVPFGCVLLMSSILAALRHGISPLPIAVPAVSMIQLTSPCRHIVDINGVSRHLPIWVSAIHCQDGGTARSRRYFSALVISYQSSTYGVLRSNAVPAGFGIPFVASFRKPKFSQHRAG